MSSVDKICFLRQNPTAYLPKIAIAVHKIEYIIVEIPSTFLCIFLCGNLRKIP